MEIRWGDPSNLIDFWETVMKGEVDLGDEILKPKYRLQNFYTEVEDVEFEMIEDYVLQERLPQPVHQDAD